MKKESLTYFQFAVLPEMFRIESEHDLRSGMNNLRS